MTQRRTGLFLDLDGTLADSLPVMRTVYDRFLVHFGRSGSDAEFDRLNGPPLVEVIADLARTHGIGQPMASLHALYREMVADAYEDVAPNQGGGALLKMAHESGIPVAIVTSNSANLAWAWLRSAGLAELVAVVVGGDDVRQGKPDPEPYLTALERTGCQSSLSLAVEDTLTGARSAAAAGIPVLLLAGTNVGIPAGVAVIDCLESVAKVMRDRRLIVESGVDV